MHACLPCPLRLRRGTSLTTSTCRVLPPRSPWHPRLPALATTRPRRVEPSSPPGALPEPFDNLLSTAVAASSAVAILVTLAAPLRSPSPPKQRHQRQQQQQQDNPEDLNFEWAVTAAVSCIPLVNSIAWLMPAISSTPCSGSTASRAQLYLLYTALYSAPLLRSGFDLDAYSLLMLGLCIVHVQAERIACTEPELLLDLPLLPGLVQVLASSTGGAREAGSSRLGSGAAGPWGDVVRGEKQADTERGEEGAADANVELKEFDRMLLEREKRRGQTKKLP